MSNDLQMILLIVSIAKNELFVLSVEDEGHRGGGIHLRLLVFQYKNKPSVLLIPWST